MIFLVIYYFYVLVSYFMFLVFNILRFVESEWYFFVGSIKVKDISLRFKCIFIFLYLLLILFYLYMIFTVDILSIFISIVLSFSSNHIIILLNCISLLFILSSILFSFYLVAMVISRLLINGIYLNRPSICYWVF